MIYYVDIDDTICDYPITQKSLNYSKARPIIINIDKINKLYEQGHEIVYYTARSSVIREDIKQIRDLTEKQLKNWGAKYHKLSVGEKPYYDIIVCDKARRIEEL